MKEREIWGLVVCWSWEYSLDRFEVGCASVEGIWKKNIVHRLIICKGDPEAAVLRVEREARGESDQKKIYSLLIFMGDPEAPVSRKNSGD